MKTREARELGQRLAALLKDGRTTQAYTLLSPVLAQRTPFRLLRHIGGAVGAGSLDPACPEQSRGVNAFLERIAAAKTEGGWVVIASALEAQLDRDLSGALARCQLIEQFRQRFAIPGVVLT